MIDHFLLFSNSKITTHNTLAYTLFELRLAKEYTSLNEAYYHYLHAANPAKKMDSDVPLVHLSDYYMFLYKLLLLM